METKLLIRGEPVHGEGAPLAVEDPATEETVATLRAASAEQLDAAVAGAREAARGWASTPAVERAELLHEAASRLRAMPAGAGA
jgi:acyl-CoA reductase-like NAD-dependent aldehyde dehydrogenase